MATGGFLALSDPAHSSSSGSEIMRKEDDLHMRLIYLTRRTCDQLSRDLTKYVIDKLYDSNWNDWLTEDPDDLKKYKKKYFKKHFEEKVPPIEECDTTLLADLLSNEIIHGGVEMFNPYIENLRMFRNKFSHNNLEIGVFPCEFQKELEKLNKFMLQLLNESLSRPIFPSLQSCLEFLSQNKNMSFEQFCAFYPSEITAFVQSLEPNLKKIAENIPSLTRLVSEHEKQLNQLTTEVEELQTGFESSRNSFGDRLDSVEKGHDVLEAKLDKLTLNPKESLQLCSSSLRPYCISGRELELEALKTSLANSQLALIHGPPGIGKTALANYYGQTNKSENQVCIEIRFENFVIPSVGYFDQHIARKIGRGIPGIPGGLEETEDPLSLLAHHVRYVLKSKHLLLIFDNIDLLLISEEGNRDLQTVTGELLKTGKGLQIIYTARYKTLFLADPYDCEVIKLDPLSEKDLQFWISEKQSEMKIEFLKEISTCSGGIPLILNLLFNYVKLHEDFTIEEFDEIKNSQVWDKLRSSLKLSFNRLENEQLLTMICASVFNGNFAAIPWLNCTSK